MNRFACSEALDCMEAHYKVALKRFIDDIAIEVIEMKLISPLGGIFIPVVVSAMAANLVTRITGESEENRSNTCKHFLGVRLLDADVTIQSEPHFNSDSANDESSNFDEVSDDSLQDDVRSLTDRSVRPGSPPPEVTVTPEVETMEGSAYRYRSLPKKSKKVSKLAAERAVFE
ncbi:MAG: hypothetical protein MMC33_007261 [Icmadophila ericetorum]|nr:hypothetical protein [Icmadophila ericetorum]